MDSLLAYGVRILCYTLTTIGVWFLLKPIIEPNIRYAGRALDKQLRLRVGKSSVRMQSSRQMTRFYKHLDNMLFLVKKDYEPGLSVFRFLLNTAGYFCSTFFIVLMTIADLPGRIQFGSNPFTDSVAFDSTEGELFWQFPVMIAIVAATIPYMILRYSFSSRNIRASYDLLEVAKILARNANGSVYEALRNTANMLSSKNVLKRQLYLLCDAFMSYGNEKDLKDVLAKFDSTIRTTFSSIFCHSLIYAEKEGSNHLGNSMALLSYDMEKQMHTVIDSHKAARDPIVLGKYGGFLTVIFVLPVAAMSLGVETYLSLQFKTKLGLITFALIIISLFLSFVISVVLSRPKLDYF